MLKKLCGSMTQFCDSHDGFKLKHVIGNRNIEIVDYVQLSSIKFKSFDSLSKKCIVSI